MRALAKPLRGGDLFLVNAKIFEARLCVRRSAAVTNPNRSNWATTNFARGSDKRIPVASPAAGGGREYSEDAEMDVSPIAR